MKMIKSVVLAMGLVFAGSAAAATTNFTCDIEVSGTVPRTFLEGGANVTDYGNSFELEVNGKSLVTPEMNRWDRPTDIFSVEQNGVVMKMRPRFDMRYYVEDRNRNVYFKMSNCVEQ